MLYKRKVMFLFLLTVLSLFTACSGSREGRTMKASINGSWLLQTINIQGINKKVKVKVFNEADFNCFIGSTWTFVSNNSMGLYKFPPGSDCPPVSRNFRWSVYEPKGAEKKFQFKRLDEKKNPIDDNDGYRLSIASLTNTSMQLRSDITFEGKPATIDYNFVKN